MGVYCLSIINSWLCRLNHSSWVWIPWQVLCAAHTEELESADFLFLPLLMEECSPVIPRHLLGLTDVKGEVIWLAALRRISLRWTDGDQANNCCAVGALQGDAAGVHGLAGINGPHKGQRVQESYFLKLIWLKEHTSSHVMNCHAEIKWHLAIVFNWGETLPATMTMLYHTITWNQDAECVDGLCRGAGQSCVVLRLGIHNAHWHGMTCDYCKGVQSTVQRWNILFTI